MILFNILNHETGDSWNGTHGHDISVMFDESSGLLTVRSKNSIYGNEFREADFLPGEVNAQLFAVVSAKYFNDFRDLMNAQYPDLLPGLKNCPHRGKSPQKGEDAEKSKLYWVTAPVLCWNGDLNPVLLNYKEPANWERTLLHEAATVLMNIPVKTLLAAGYDHSLKDVFGATALHFSAGSGSADTTQLLLDAGADIDAKKNDGKTPLELAVWSSNKETVALLLDRGADPYKCSEDIFKIADAMALKKPASLGVQMNREALVQILKDWKRQDSLKRSRQNLARLDAMFPRRKMP